jgi:nicotinate-nucleotide adenylyltransferase
MTFGQRIGILGGTLDPIHLGHVEAAVAARRAMNLDRVIVLPSRVPPHRQHQPLASPYHRFAMAALAVNPIDGMMVSDLELRAPGPSYTADTLTRLQGLGLTALQIFFITGADAFAEIATWRRYPAVLELAQFVVVSRPGDPVATMRGRLPQLADRMREDTGAGGHDGKTSIFLVDAPTPDVSSTEIRRRLREGGTLWGLVPAAVEAHILRNGLYVNNPAADHLHGQD